MNTVAGFFSALREGHTYDPRRNIHLWFGFLWGLPIPVFSIWLQVSALADHEVTILEIFRTRPIHYLFLAHPFLFGLVFGALGTMRRKLEVENAKLIAELRELALTDPLTGAYNRRHVLEELRNHLLRAQRGYQPIGVALFDLDDFKEVNEKGGHLAGDQALRDVAKALRATTRQGDLLGRYGGDEFLLVVLADRPTTERLVERSREAVKEGSGLGISAGISEAPADGTTPEQLIRAADQRLAEVKAKRRVGRGTARR